MKENGIIVRCPRCNSTNVIKVRGFDFVKMCMNNDCEYHITHPKKYRYQFAT